MLRVIGADHQGRACAGVKDAGQHFRFAQSRTGAQRPQRASQQTDPTLHVLMPHCWLTGKVGPSSQVARLHGAPGSAQIPQLALQHTWPTLHVLAPHLSLPGTTP